ncbi:MAG TPA: 6-bladed beta-propeller, partial [Planctomycetaceae bacterium]|nr:6-bladed beta-propeller [Planctomycetaceae bacterium]
MNKCLNYLAVAVVLSVTVSLSAAEKVAPVRMGCGVMTFDTVPGWG